MIVPVETNVKAASAAFRGAARRGGLQVGLRKRLVPYGTCVAARIALHQIRLASRQDLSECKKTRLRGFIFNGGEGVCGLLFAI
jgi:hypothetical protein